MLYGSLEAAVPLLSALQRDSDCWLHAGTHWLRGIQVLLHHRWERGGGREERERGGR